MAMQFEMQCTDHIDKILVLNTIYYWLLVFILPFFWCPLRTLDLKHSNESIREQKVTQYIHPLFVLIDIQ